MSNGSERLKEAHSTSYTPEQLENLPQTTKIFDRPEMTFDDHDWQQQGYMITDICSPKRADCHNVGIPIPSGKMLVKRNGKYDIVPEGPQTR